MHPDKYQELAQNTEASTINAMDHIDMSTDQGITLFRLIHASFGMCTEAGEFQDALKKHIFYGKKLDFVNLQEEVGDIMWYVALACNAMGVSLDKIMDTNIQKLKARYPEKFTSEKAQNRDLAKERKILEGDTNV